MQTNFTFCVFSFTALKIFLLFLYVNNCKSDFFSFLNVYTYLYFVKLNNILVSIYFSSDQYWFARCILYDYGKKFLTMFSYRINSHILIRFVKINIPDYNFRTLKSNLFFLSFFLFFWNNFRYNSKIFVIYRHQMLKKIIQ